MTAILGRFVPGDDLMVAEYLAFTEARGWHWVGSRELATEVRAEDWRAVQELNAFECLGRRRIPVPLLNPADFAKLTSGELRPRRMRRHAVEPSVVFAGLEKRRLA